MKIDPSKIRDVERLQRYEKIFRLMLKFDRFSREDIWRCKESKQLIGRAINLLVKEGSLCKEPGKNFKWEPSRKLLYKNAWVDRVVSTHQLKRLDKLSRPREKLLTFGPAKLMTSELLAIFLRAGIKGKSVVSLASELLNKFGGVRGIFEASNKELLQVEGLGVAKVAQIKAVHALAEEYLKEKTKARRVVRNSKEIFDYLYHTMRDLKREVFKVIFLDGGNQIIDIKDLFEGTLNSSSIYPREVIKNAIENDAVNLVFVHNHPSGNPEPSQSDKDITEELVFAGNLMQIKVLDHIIIGDNKYFSFADEGLIEEYHLNFLSMKRGKNV